MWGTPLIKKEKIKKMTPRTTSFARHNTMAICAPDLALGYFSFYSSPAKSLAYHSRNITQLLPIHMIKFKHTNICATAINTWMV